MKSIKLMSQLMLKINKKYFCSRYGREFYRSFKREVDLKLDEMIPEVPEIGDSIFKSSYWMAVFLIAWFKVMKEKGISAEEANYLIWDVIENGLKMIPSILVPIAKKIYLNPMIRKATSHSEKSKKNILPEYDWKIEYIRVDANTFYLNTYECGIKKLCKKFRVEEMLPSLCRLDYMVSHYLKSGFERTQTLGDGDEMCNNKFMINGSCEWHPEKGFVNRK